MQYYVRFSAQLSSLHLAHQRFLNNKLISHLVVHWSLKSRRTHNLDRAYYNINRHSISLILDLESNNNV